MSKNVGILDPLGKKDNPLTNKPYENLYKEEKQFEFPPGSKKMHDYTYKNISKIWTNLIVYKKRLEMIKTIKNCQVSLIKAGTGVGKTVLLPKFALHAGNYKDKVICCIPKKIITLETADFAAKCLDVKLGAEVGYYYKGDRNVSDKTVLTFTTIGSLFSRITGDDPLLKDYKIVIIDEAHERSIQTDFTLLLIKEILEKRKDLKLVIMSATIDLNKFRNFFKKFKFGEVDAGSETTYKITSYFAKEKILNWKESAINIIIKILKETKKGDILVFVRSGNDGKMLCKLLSDAINIKDYNPFCVQLESKSSKRLHPVSQIPQSKYATHEILYKSHPDRHKSYPYTRKVVMSTNVAESSITVKGIVFVIDSGLEFVDKYNPRNMCRSLLDEFVPQSAVKQRMGRAGRTQPGTCYHLYSKNQFMTLQPFPTPDIQKSDLSSEFLDLLRMDSIKTVPKLKEYLSKLIDPPVSVFVNNGINILESLKCIENNKLTEIGVMITHFRGIKPLYAKAIIISHFLECKRNLIDLIALLILTDSRFNDIFTVRDKVKVKDIFIYKDSEHLTLLNVIKEYNKNLETSSSELSRLARDHKSNRIYHWCVNNHINFKTISQIKEKAINITQILNKVLKEFPKFKIKVPKLSNEDNKIIYCLTHDINIAKNTRNNIYTTIFPKEKIEVNLKKTLGQKIIFDELFLSRRGYKFNIITKI